MLLIKDLGKSKERILLNKELFHLTSLAYFFRRVTENNSTCAGGGGVRELVCNPYFLPGGLCILPTEQYSFYHVIFLQGKYFWQVKEFSSFYTKSILPCWDNSCVCFTDQITSVSIRGGGEKKAPLVGTLLDKGWVLAAIMTQTEYEIQLFLGKELKKI